MITNHNNDHKSSTLSKIMIMMMIFRPSTALLTPSPHCDAPRAGEVGRPRAPGCLHGGDGNGDGDGDGDDDGGNNDNFDIVDNDGE